MQNYETNDMIKVLYVEFRMSSLLKNSILLNLDPNNLLHKLVLIHHLHTVNRGGSIRASDPFHQK